MRILIICDCYLPNIRSSAVLVHDLAVEFRRRGHEVVVATPDHDLDRPACVNVEDGVSVLRVRTGKIKDVPLVIRAINEVRLSSAFWRRAKKFLLAQPWDLIVFYSPTVFFGALVQKLKSRFDCPAYLILRDIFPQWALDIGFLRKGPIYRFFCRKEHLQYEVADVIGVQSPANLRYFAQHGLEEIIELEVLYNWIAQPPQPLPKTDYRRRLGLEGKVVFVFGGNMGVAQDMDNILRLACSLRGKSDIRFLLVGEGREVPRLTAAVEAHGLKNLLIHPGIPREEYLGMLAEFDVGLISLHWALTTQNFPGKMLGYMYNAMPILASINPGNDLADVIGEHNAGMVCLNGEDDRLRDCTLQLARDADLRRRLGQNARALMEGTFSVSRAAGQILSHVVKPAT